MDQKTEIMVALGVAIGVNCIPCFDHLYSKIDTLKDNDKIGSWLFRIAYRLCMDHFRKESRNPPEEIANFEGMNTSRYSTTQRKLEQHQMSVCVQNQVLLLPENYRTVIWLFDVLGFTLKEVANILGLSVENVKIRLHRARKKLKFILSQNCSLEKDERNVLVCEPRNGVNWRRDRVDGGHGLMDFAKTHRTEKQLIIFNLNGAKIEEVPNLKHPRLSLI